MCTSVLSKQFMCNQVKEEEICVQYIQRSADSELKEGLSEKRKKISHLNEEKVKDDYVSER